jgi:hypothetical protein
MYGAEPSTMPRGVSRIASGPEKVRVRSGGGTGRRFAVAATAARRASDLHGTVRTLGVDPDRIAGALRAVADWLDQRTPAAGAAVDQLIAALDAAAAPVLGQLTPAAAEAERDERLRDSARAAIATRIKSHVRP